MAYTKYSLTPANNNAAPPDGAPEGMLPSAVNDTMRDMMAQIRDVGDGIRGGTYTMTAPIITGGTITGVALTGNTFTSPVISGGSINNTPIGATTASTGAFSTLSATGVTTVQAGTVSAPAITTTGDTNTGIFFPAADTIAFTEGGVESMRITSAGDVGIGNASPGNKLDVSGTIRSLGTTNNITVERTSSDSASFISKTSLGNFGAGTGIASATNCYNIFDYTASAERMRIDSSGNVGINTTGPSDKLTVTGGLRSNGATGNANVTGALLDWNANTRLFAYDSAGAGILFYTTPSGGSVTERMRINSIGNLGLGTTAPSSISANYTTLDIRGSAGGGMLMGITGSTHTYMYTDSGGSNMFTNAAIPLQFGTNNGERMRITSGGELLIGATSNATPTSSTSMAVLQSNFRNGGTYGMGMSFNSTGATGADHYYISFNTGTTTQRGYIYYNNGAGQVQLSATSDARLKENIVDAPSILPILDQVKVRQYDWKDTGNTNIGFVAQELYDVIPRAVAVGEDNENGSIKRVWGVDNGTLVPYLVKAIQELNAKITALENK
jgi:hypothetical protein